MSLTAVVLPSVPEPVAFFPLNVGYKAAEKENRQPKGILGDVAITNGPYNEPGGSYMFYGTVNSYITFPNKGGLYTLLSITLMCWVKPGGQDGVLFSYGFESFTMGIQYGKLFHTLNFYGGITTPDVLPKGKWVHVAASYDHNTGNSSLYINGHLRTSTYSGRGVQFATTAQTIRMGSVPYRIRGLRDHFKGKIAEMKVYDVSLNEKQIQTSIRQVPPKVIFPAGLLAIQGGMLSCAARGTPPIYTALIRTSTVLANTTNTATIRLYKDGNYTCQAINQYGTDMKELQVNFKTFGPEIGFLTSEGYPHSYPRNADMNSPAYPIPEGWSMNIYFQDFDLEESPACSKDFLRITDGVDETFGEYCGNKTVGQNLRVTGEHVQIMFHSDGDTERRGYLLNFTLVSLPSFSSVPAKGSAGQPTQQTAIFKERMIYISSAIGFTLLLVLCVTLGFWRYRRSHHKRIKRSARSAREIIPFDKWELLPEQIEYQEELGRGAFGVVYKATLKRRVGIKVFDTENTPKPEEASQVVAVKKLQDDTTEDQKQEFLHEIEQMKLLGAHQNIVSLVGCCTLQEHKFLVLEYVPFGDLLQWLRRRRRSINRNQGTQGGNEEKKCYEDKGIFSAQKEESECDQPENRNDLLDQKMIELMPMPSTSQENSNAAAILISTENMKNDDDDKEEGNNNAFLDQEKIEMLSMPTTSQGKDNASTSPISTENIDSDDADPDEGNCNDFLQQESMEQLSMPSTSLGNINVAAILVSTENIDDDDDEEADSFTTQKLFSFAWQIAKGMNHLAEKGFIHRDLAARNILVGTDNQVKVSDFGLMREIYEDVYSGKNAKKLPVKWMAPESINDSIYTIKSDVWSFGVLLWEMATMGGVPYPTLSNRELCQLLKTGFRMERPDMCCDEIYELMSECWNEDPSSRPSFSELIDRLEVIMTRDVPYCDLNKHDESRPYYNVPANTDEHSG